jgi:uncharacterized protein
MSALLDIAADWSPWEGTFPPSIPRRLPLPTRLHDSLALVIQGVRRCGKSTLMRQLVQRYDLPRERCLFLNCEDPRLANALRPDLLDRLQADFASRTGTGPRIFFLDEIQQVPGWQRWLRLQLDRPNGEHFVLSGSNASLLSGELGSTLTGRHLSVVLHPFDLTEFRELRPGESVSEWLSQGGFPEPLRLFAEDPASARALLRQYFIDIVERDVRERIGARSSLALRSLVQMVFEAAGSELSLRRIAAAQGVAVETAGAWLDACQDAFLLHECPFFAWSERKRAARNSKYYPADPALRQAVITPGAPDRGKALECAAFLALRRHFETVYYWRGRGEVDFVVLQGDKPLPVQVSLDRLLPRHESALESFYEEFPQSGEAILVTEESFEETMAGLGH